MKNQSFFSVAFIALLTTWVFIACNNDRADTSESGGALADSNTTDNAIDTTGYTASDMADEHYDFNYEYIDEEAENADNTANETQQKSKPVNTSPKKPKVKSQPAVYTISQTDRPPLFSPDCATAKDPERCSNKAIADWARKSVKYPEADLAQGSDGLEYVTFIINKKGEVNSVSRVDSKIEACEGCSQAVLNAVLDMPNWQPAMLNGKPVDVVVTLPVRFRSL